ncbi:FecCD family ABC transporter permease [Arthrobacter sp. 35W]|uniref:FecCD family ABC transporter permease n=1 Tax=Arthrobacter sp. 35W TaxID=1132441 RepID=UPI00040136DF|nr:iron ABC transporter permease [Arthrobacter sp. 35W]
MATSTTAPGTVASTAAAAGNPAAAAVGRARRPAAQRVWAVAAVVVLGLLVLASLAVGARYVPLPVVLDALANPDAANGDHAVVISRIARTVAALLVGAALGLSGTAMQGLARNPLADPGILGVNAGASLAVVAAIFFLGAASVSSYIWFAFAGAAVAAVVVYSVASLGREGATPVKLALAGAAVSAGLVSIMSALLLSSQDSLELFRRWQVGALAGKSWESIGTVAPFMAVGMVILLFTGKLLNNLSLGDDVARSLGQRPGLGRAVSAVGIVLLCGSATALAGPIAFIGLVVPHLLRALVGPDYRWLLPLSLVAAPAVLLFADVLGRVLLMPAEIPAGILAAFIGAPVFIAVVRRGRSAAL